MVDGRRRRRLARTGAARIAVAAVAVVAVAVGLVAYRAGGGSDRRELGVVWAAPVDGGTGVGSWVTGETVIRARADGVVAYALADGRVAWTYSVPAGQELCTMSRAVVGGVGLVGYGPAGGYHCTTVVGLDTGTGRELWQRQRPVPEGYSDTRGDEVALTGDVAIVAEPSGFVAVDPRGNAPRWRFGLPPGCHAYSATAAGGTAALLAACTDETTRSRAGRLAVVDAATGRVRWRAPLGITGEDEHGHQYGGAKATVVLSLDPVVVRTSDEGGAAGAFVSFDARGGRRAVIHQSQDGLALAPDQFPQANGWYARPTYTAVVAGDVLVTSARMPDDDRDRHVAGFSLADGRRLWLTEAGDWLSGLGLGLDGAAGRVVARDERPHSTELIGLSSSDGRLLERVGLDGDADVMEGSGDGSPEVWAVGDRYVFVNPGSAGLPPVAVLR